MASIGKQHQELDEQGIGKCSVPEDNTSLPMEYIIRHGIGVSVPAPHPAPEPEESPELAQAVEQSENKQDCPSRLGDVVERLSNFPEPELPPLDAPTQEDLDRSHLLCGLGTRIEVAHRELQGTWLHLQCRERQLLASLRENQQLRQRCEELAAQELVVRQQQQRLSNLSNGATADQAVFAHIHKILDEAQVPRSQKIEGQKHSVWLTTPRRVEWLVETIAARSMRLNEAVQDAVARNIDLVKYNGKTIREWIELLNTLQQQLAQKDKRIAELEGGKV